MSNQVRGGVFLGLLGVLLLVAFIISQQKRSEENPQRSEHSQHSEPEPLSVEPLSPNKSYSQLLRTVSAGRPSNQDLDLDLEHRDVQL